jgi:hypothetical protein
MALGRRTMLGGLAAIALAPGRTRAQSDAATVLRDAIALSGRLACREISPVEWQDAIERTLGGTDVAGIASIVGVEGLRRTARRVERGASVVMVPATTGLRAPDDGAIKVFFLEAGRSNPPHCHYNMVSAHLVLSGRVRVRHFAREREDESWVDVRPTIDRVLGPGELTTVSDARDNVHWHMALEPSVLFDVLQGRLDPAIPARPRSLLDPDRGTRTAEGWIRAPRIDRERALERYG